MALTRRWFLGMSTILTIEIRYHFPVDVMFAEIWQSMRLLESLLLNALKDHPPQIPGTQEWIKNISRC